LAEHSGYCFGVRQALQRTEEILSRALPGREVIYACGPLIHNASVMKELSEKGLRFISEPEEAEAGATIIVRSHGEGREFYARAEKQKLKIVDTTCPFVSRIRRLAADARAEGRSVLIIGDRTHPEVVGINGWCGNSAIIADSVAEAREIRRGKLFVVAQTTATREHFDEISACLTENNADAVISNTICDATAKRQESCKKTAQMSDIMIIIGDKSSANTRNLYGIAQKNCKKSYFVENIEDLPLKGVKKCNTIGIAAGASTPERVIKEVIAAMSEINVENEKDLMGDFMDEIERSLRLPRNGEILTGTVIQVSDRDVIVNLGCKKDGVIPRDEIALEGDQKIPDLFKEGDEVQVKVLKTDDNDGNILLSKKKVIISEYWEDVNIAYEEKTSIEAKVIKAVNGGVIAVFKEIYGFIPLSQLSDRFVDRADEFVGSVFMVKVSRVDQKRNKVVFSRKAVLIEERRKRMEEIWDSLNVGDTIEGTVMRFTDYGAFVDIGGIDGLLHISEISWGKLKHPQEVLEIGEKINVKILSMNREKEKISLGYKQNLPEPWSIIDEKYAVGQVVSGKAVQIKDYGVFVELEPGLDGLVHISEIAFKRVANISDEISVGQQIKAKILDVDKARRRISLSIRETLERPEEAKTDAVETATEDSEKPAEAGTADAVESAFESSEEPAETKAAGATESAAEISEETAETEAASAIEIAGAIEFAVEISEDPAETETAGTVEPDAESDEELAETGVVVDVSKHELLIVESDESELKPEVSHESAPVASVANEKTDETGENEQAEKSAAESLDADGGSASDPEPAEEAVSVESVEATDSE
jgi:4-hydroxy-3-methylbut-2-enyl diphosphate reductase